MMLSWMVNNINRLYLIFLVCLNIGLGNPISTAVTSAILFLEMYCNLRERVKALYCRIRDRDYA